MANIGKWSTKWDLDSSGFTSGMQKAQKDAAQAESTIGRHFEGIKQKASSAFSAVAGGSGISGAYSAMGFLGAGAALGTVTRITGAVQSYVNEGIAAIRMQSRFSMELGVTRDRAAALIALAGVSGTSPEELQSASMMGLRHIGELRNELAAGGRGGPSGAALRFLGIDPAEFAQLGSFSAQLGRVGDAMRNVGNAADRAAIGHAIFGRGWESLQPQLRLGSEGMQRLENLAREFGVSIGGEAANSVGNLGRQTQEYRVAVQLAADATRNQFTTAFVEAADGARTLEARLQRLRDMQPIRTQAARVGGQVTGTVRRWWDDFWSFTGAGADILFGGPPIGQVHPPIPGAATGSLAQQAAAAGNVKLTQSSLSANAAFAIEEVTAALERQRLAYGMTAEEARRAEFVRAGADEKKLAALDKEIELMRERQRFEQESADLIRLTSFAITPIDRIRARLGEIRAYRPSLSPREQGAALMNAIGGNIPREAQALGSLSANTSEAAAVLQEAMLPEVDQLASMESLLQSIFDESQRQTELWDRAGGDLGRIGQIISDMAEALGS